MFFFAKSLLFIFSSTQTQSAERDRWINLSLEASNEVSQKKCSFFFKCGGGGVCRGDYVWYFAVLLMLCKVMSRMRGQHKNIRCSLYIKHEL